MQRYNFKFISQIKHGIGAWNADGQSVGGEVMIIWHSWSVATRITSPARMLFTAMFVMLTVHIRVKCQRCLRILLQPKFCLAVVSQNNTFPRLPVLRRRCCASCADNFFDYLQCNRLVLEFSDTSSAVYQIIIHCSSSQKNVFCPHLL